MWVERLWAAAMGTKSTPEQAERAARLREKIERLKHPEPTSPTKSPDQGKRDELSPREFIERKMRELDRRKEDSKE
jgi:hypothetical protein